MKNYKPEIKKEKKQPQKVHAALLVVIWALFALIIVLDAYRFIYQGSGVTTSDIICDGGILAAAIYLTIRYKKDGK